MSTVRVATRADAPRLARMRFDFRTALKPAAEERERFVARCSEWMEAQLAPGAAWRCFVVEREGELVGQLWLQLVEKIPNPSPEPERHAYVTNVYVEEPARGAGLGSALLVAALDFCRSTGVDSVFLWPSERSRALYARHGFEGAGSVMELKLERGP